VKTSISMPQTLFERAERLSRVMGISRSQLYAKAVGDFVRRHEGPAVLGKLNQVYAEAPDGDEKDVCQRARARIRKHLEGRW